MTEAATEYVPNDNATNLYTASGEKDIKLETGCRLINGKYKFYRDNRYLGQSSTKYFVKSNGDRLHASDRQQKAIAAYEEYLDLSAIVSLTSAKKLTTL